MNSDVISPRDAFDRLRTGGGGDQVLLVDVRTPVEFAAVHADGAVLVPQGGVPDVVARLVSKGVRPTVYAICKTGARARNAVRQLRDAGYTEASCVEGGTDAWVAAGLPVIRGRAGVVSLERQVRMAAGTLVVSGTLLGWLVHPAFIGLAAFVGAGLVFAGATDWCGMGMVLAKLPWNRRGGETSAPVCDRQR
jgi:rhodanese-related sulfurtransferase